MDKNGKFKQEETFMPFFYDKILSIVIAETIKDSDTKEVLKPIISPGGSGGSFGRSTA